MRSKKKDYASIGATIAILGITGTLLFYPQAVGNFDKSYVSLNEKKLTIESNNDLLQQNEVSIQDKQGQFIAREKEEKEVSKRAADLKGKINPEDFVLDVPSFLIDLEQEAYKNKVKFEIGFNQIKWGASANRGSGTAAPAQDPNVTPTQPNVKTGSAVQEPGSTQEFDQEAINAAANVDDGFDRTVVPVLIVGGFHEVRNYIKYLDGLGLIDPTKVILNSDEKVVTSQILLSIVHGEVLR